MPQNIDILKDHQGKVRLGHQDSLYVSASLKNDEEAVVAFSDQHFNRVTVWDGEIRSTGGTAIILNDYCTVSIISSG